ncbi:MAG TPA: trigger factor [Patescibacteria group bacterium]|nr:trigger factor [Patescibacteria group bacterium]
MISAIQKLEDGTISLTITIPSERVEEVKKQVADELVVNTELPGFRKGKAPKNLVLEKLDKEKLKEEVLKKLLPETYVEAIKEHSLNPIVSPQIHVLELADGKDWQYTALTSELPEVDLGSYKENIQKITAKKKIIVPGKKEETPISFEDITKEVLASVKVKIPKLITETEADRLLSQTLDEIKRLGMTLDQYLASTGKNAQSLRAEYEAKATNDIKFEFALQKIADSENIQVTDEEIDRAIKEAKTEEEKKSLEANKYLLATIIRQRKTLDFLRSL